MSVDQTAEETPTVGTDEHGSSIAQRLRSTFGNRRNKILFLAIICPATVLVTLSALWILDDSDDAQVELGPQLTPQQVFDQECKVVREKRLETLHLADSKVTDEMVARIADMDWLEAVIFDQGVLTDDSLTTLQQLPSLNHVRLRNSPITDEGFKTISQMQTLWYLNLPHADCTSTGVAHLQKLPQLRQLRLGSKRLGNDVTEQIAKMKGLRGVHLIGIPITDDGLEILAGMPHLESLYLDDSAVTEAGWERLFRDHPDLHVHVNQRHHDRDPKAHRHHD